MFLSDVRDTDPARDTDPVRDTDPCSSDDILPVTTEGSRVVETLGRATPALRRVQGQWVTTRGHYDGSLCRGEPVSLPTFGT